MKQTKHSQDGYYKFSNEAFAAYLMCRGYLMDRIQKVDDFDYLFYFKKGEFFDDPRDEGLILASLINDFLCRDKDIDLQEYCDHCMEIQLLISNLNS